jgi:NADH dehydrogenase FAD-containing subunit
LVAQAAIQQGRTLAKNLKITEGNKSVRPFIYKDKGDRVDMQWKNSKNPDLNL